MKKNLNFLFDKKSTGKRMKKTPATIFITDDKKEEVSLIKKRNVRRKGSVFFVKVIKKNQIILFGTALLLVGIGYLTYDPERKTNFVSTTLDNSTFADLGDATFVSSQKIIDKVEENKIVNNQNSIKNTNEEKSEKESENNIEKNNQNYFINSKIDREKMYSQILENYQKILENNSVGPEEKAIATNEIKRINNEKNSIMIVENLIKNKGFEDVIVFINIENESVNIVVKSEELEKAQVAQIQNIVERELKIDIENIHISNKKT